MKYVESKTHPEATSGTIFARCTRAGACLHYVPELRCKQERFGPSSRACYQASVPRPRSDRSHIEAAVVWTEVRRYSKNVGDSCCLMQFFAYKLLYYLSMGIGLESGMQEGEHRA